MQTSSSFADALPHLDDQDVAVLYDIVSLAQESSQRPIKALFDAYEQLLSPLGADSDPDSRYFRFLSHAGTYLAKYGTGGIVNRFRTLLSRAGIQLVLEGGDDGVASVYSEQGLDYLDPPRGRSMRRRASFNDSNLDTTRLGIDERHMELDQRVPRHSSYDPGSRYRSALITGQVPNAHKVRNPYSRNDVDYESAHEHPVPLIDEGRLVAAAEAFEFEALGRKYLWLWLARAQRVVHRQHDLAQIATNHDKRTLLRQSFGQVRESVTDVRFWQQQERRAARVRGLFLLTKAFTHWAQLASEETARTNVARRHILRTRYFHAWRDIAVANEIKCRRPALHRWFSLWHSRAIQQKDDAATAAAFLHSNGLRRAYWTWFWAFCERKAPAWKDIRLQTHVFAKWNARATATQQMALAAEGTVHSRLQRHALHSIQQRAARVCLDEDTAFMFRQRHLRASALGAWCRKSAFDPREMQIRRSISRRTMQQALTIWRRTTSMECTARSVNRKRLLSGTLTIWNDNLRISCLRFKLDDRIVLRVLYKWVLEERYKLFQRVTEHRAKGHAMQQLSRALAEHQFRLQEAFDISQHNQEIRSKQTAVVQLHSRVRLMERMSATAAEFRNASLLPRVFNLWKAKSSHLRQLQTWAAQARFFCLASSTTKRWQAAVLESQRTKRREGYARLRNGKRTKVALHCLQVLRQKASAIARHREQSERYHRDVAAVLVRGCLVKWHARTAQRVADEEKADAIITTYQLGDALSAMILRLSDISQQTARAEAMSRQAQARTLVKMFRRFGDTIFVLNRQEETAEAWRDRKFNLHQKAMVRHWSARTREQRTARTVAIDPDSPSKTPMLRASRRSRNYSALFEEDASFADTSIDLTTQPRPDTFRFSARADADFAALTPLPAHLLRTPRRTARTGARFRSVQERTPGVMDFGSSVLGSTTPAPLAAGSLEGMEALTPQVTPFQRRLRAGGYAQGSTTPVSVMEGGGGRDTGKTVRFGGGLDDG